MTTQHSILVADDDPTIRRLLLRVARTSLPWLHTIEAQNGAEALGLIQQHTFVLIITDYHMPGASGLDVLHAARARWSQVPVVVISAQLGVEAAVLAAGATAFVAKPFDVPRLMALLRSLVPMP